MSSQSRTHEPPVSLPSIHELFPEHLMNAPPGSGAPKVHHLGHQRHSSHTSPPYRAQPLPPPSRGSSSRGDVPRGTNEPSYPYHPRHPQPVHAQHPGATAGIRPLGAPHLSGPPADGPSSFSPQPMSPMPPRDIHRQDRPSHPIVSIPPSHSGRPPKSQEHPRHPDAQSMTYPGSSLVAPALDDPENLSDEDTPTGAPSGIPRKHICPICHKAFNRPSSLKIHYNTHTGATPFRCPWPKCGREFNVNSNMRRHYRNHTTSANQEAQDDGAARRRRRRSSASSPQPPPVMQQSIGETRAQPPPLPSGRARHQAASPSQYDDDVPSHLSDPSHQYSRYRVYEYGKDSPTGMTMDMDDVDEYRVSEDPRRSNRLPVPVMRTSQTLVAEPRGSEQPNSRFHGAPTHPHHSHPHPPHSHHQHTHSSSSASMRIRALTPGSSFHSSSPSPSPSPSLSSSVSESPYSSPPPSTMTSPAHSPAMLPRQHGHGGQQQHHHHQYSPSMAYLRNTTGDPHVSTALRPAFTAPARR